MNKKSLIAVIACFIILNASAQTLFTYGKYSVDAKNFLRAYNKNNAQLVVNKAKAINNYLDLYIKSRLKIQEAYERRYDTLPQIKTEVENMKKEAVKFFKNYNAPTDQKELAAFSSGVKDAGRKARFGEHRDRARRHNCAFITGRIAEIRWR